MNDLLVTLSSHDARAPTRSSEGAAGYDLYSTMDCILLSRTFRRISTGLRIQLPSDCYGRIAPRSSLAVKGVSILGGVIDSDYRGVILVIMHNTSYQDIQLRKGDRIAQLIIEKCASPQVRVVDCLDPTMRGSGGFGSTGK